MGLGKRDRRLVSWLMLLLLVRLRRVVEDWRFGITQVEIEAGWNVCSTRYGG